MKKLLLPITAGALFLSLICLSSVTLAAQPADSDTSGTVMAELTTMTATVQAVDYKKRTLTLKDPDGSIATMDVNRNVKNLEQVKPEDKLELDLYKSVVVYLSPKKGKPEAIGVAQMGIAPRGDKPGVETVDILEVIARVDAVDHKNHTITLTGPQGGTVVLAVDRNEKHFNEIKKGDDVVAQVTEAVVMEIRKP